MSTNTTEEQNVPANRGGKREGAGRKPRPDRVITASIAMRPAHWEKLDSMRGEKSRSAWMRDVIEAHDNGATN
jgi:hypothetical protein